MFGQFTDFTYLCTMKLKDNQYEVYVDGKLLRLVTGHKTFENFLERYKNRMYKKGYTIVEEYSCHFTIFVNYKEQKCQFLSYRNWIGLRDKNGDKIYYGDSLENEDGESCGFYNYLNPNNYVLAIHHRHSYRYEPDIEFDNLDICKEMGISIKRSAFGNFRHF